MITAPMIGIFGIGINLLWLIHAAGVCINTKENKFDYFLAVVVLNFWAFLPCVQMIKAG